MPVTEGDKVDEKKDTGIDEALAKAMRASDEPDDLGDQPPADAPPADEPPKDLASDEPPATADEPPAVVEPVKPIVSDQSGVQRRIDEITAQVYEERRAREAAQRELEALKAQAAPSKAGPKTIEDYTEDELFWIIEQKPEYAAQAQAELATRRAVTRVERKLQTERQQVQVQQRQVALSQESTKLLERYPELKDPNSQLRQLASQKYDQLGFTGPGALTAAVALAREDLSEKTAGTLQREKVRLDKARAKSPISPAAPGGRTLPASTVPDLKKLEQAAVASGNDMSHPAWLAYLKATSPKKE